MWEHSYSSEKLETQCHFIILLQCMADQSLGTSLQQRSSSIQCRLPIKSLLFNEGCLCIVIFYQSLSSIGNPLSYHTVKAPEKTSATPGTSHTKFHIHQDKDTLPSFKYIMEVRIKDVKLCIFEGLRLQKRSAARLNFLISGKFFLN